MGLRIRKSIKLGGGAKINLSKSGIGYSVGTKGLRYTKKAGGGSRTTASIPGTGISYVEETGGSKRSSGRKSSGNGDRKKRRTWLWIVGWLLIFPLPLTILLMRKKNLHPAIKFPIIIGAWLFYLLIVLLYGTLDDDEQQGDTRPAPTVAETTQAETEAAVEVDGITIDNLSSEFVLGDTAEITAAVTPKNADNAEVMWSSSNENVAVIDDNGMLKAVGEGTATITASTANGTNTAQEIKVDGSKHRMYVRYNRDRDDDVNIGDEWSFTSIINGENAERDYILAIGDELEFYERYTEEDNDPDVGEASTSHSVTEEDLQNGFEVTMDMTVTENGGKNSGQSAHFVIKYEFLTEAR